MPNTSATGGPLLPAVAPAPLEGLTLNEFLQGLVAGITGLDGTLVRPRYQTEPSNIPQAFTAWCAVGSQVRRRESQAYVVHNPDGDGSDHLQRQEQLDVLCSFYDTGSSGEADSLAAVLMDGLAIEQNRTPLFLEGMGLVAAPSEATAVPSLMKQRWLYRVDTMFQINRKVKRTYAILSLTSAFATLYANDAGQRVITQPITIAGG